ncbi:MAG: hypothetical protein JW955_18490, partial [Sedimentisphaerales bacterium]|nr:hypothetical protein [Sedimentisphaerales bacterium]
DHDRTGERLSHRHERRPGKEFTERKLLGLRNGEGEKLHMRSGWDEHGKGKVIDDLTEYRKAKDDDPCRHEQVILVGFSDGATTIFRLFNKWDEELDEALTSSHGGEYKIAYVGFIDMVRDEFKLNLRRFREPGKEVDMEDGGLIVAGDNFFQQDDVGFHKWKGHVRVGNRNVIKPQPIAGVSHKGGLFGDIGFILNAFREPPSIIKDPGMRNSLIKNAVDAYLNRETGGVRDRRDPPVN